MSEHTPLHLFEAFGVELEYMVVDARTLSVLPIVDRLFHRMTGAFSSDVERAEISWSNELAAHVVELKTTEPAASLESLPELFQKNVTEINAVLAEFGARLMPTAMHPWMDPAREMKLWPHESSAIYEAFNRVFDCRGHGWANLQSVHLNLPFHGDDEFGRLHAAVRLLLPILPALAASSPVVEGRLSEFADARLDFYRANAKSIPSVSGRVIPEPAYTAADYDRMIFQPMYRDISPHDPGRILRHEWLNARGAIARFDRHTIEIRVLDVQECPRADVAICAAAVSVLRALIDERWSSFARQKECDTELLAGIFQQTIRDADAAAIGRPDYLVHFGYPGETSTAGELWRHLLAVHASASVPQPLAQPLEAILAHGSLSRRIRNALGDSPPRGRIEAVYGQLCDDLAAERIFGNPLETLTRSACEVS